MMRTLSLGPIAVLALFLVAGCGADDPAPDPKETTYDVRGRFLGTASEGRDVVVHHEPMPGVMDKAMIMTLPIETPDDVEALDKGDPMAFTLIKGTASLRVRDLKKLPDTTTLNLPAPSDTSKPPSPATDDPA